MVAVDLQEIWLMLNEPPSSQIYVQGQPLNHPMLNNGDRVIYHFIWRNNDTVAHKVVLHGYINDVLDGVMTADQVPAGSDVSAWIPALGEHIVNGKFVMKAVMSVDDKYFKTCEVEWNGSEAFLREYVEAPPISLLTVALIAVGVAGAAGAVLFAIKRKRKAYGWIKGKEMPL